MKADRVTPVGVGAGRAGAEVCAPAFVVTTRWLRVREAEHRGLVWAGAGAQLCVEFECVRVCAAMCGIGVVTREVCRVPAI